MLPSSFRSRNFPNSLPSHRQKKKKKRPLGKESEGTSISDLKTRKQAYRRIDVSPFLSVADDDALQAHRILSRDRCDIRAKRYSIDRAGQVVRAMRDGSFRNPMTSMPSIVCLRYNV